MMHSLALVMAGKVPPHVPTKLVHVRPTAAAASDTSASVIAHIPLSAHCSPLTAHTTAQLWYASPRYHCGATVAVADDETPRVRLDVGVVLAVLVGENVGLLLGVCDAVEAAVRVLLPVAVPDALAPRVRLFVGVGVLLAVAVDVDVRLRVGVAVVVRVLVPVAVPDALAPRVRLRVGVYVACGQKHIGFIPL